MSSIKFSINKIADISGSSRDTVSSWIDKWEQFGINSLEDKPRSGNLGILTPEEKQLVIELCEENPRSISTLIVSSQ